MEAIIMHHEVECLIDAVEADVPRLFSLSDKLKEAGNTAMAEEVAEIAGSLDENKAPVVRALRPEEFGEADVSPEYRKLERAWSAVSEAAESGRLPGHARSALRITADLLSHYLGESRGSLHYRVELGLGERNQLAAIVAQRMQNAGEAVSEHFNDHTPEGAKAGAATIARFTPLREAIGWETEVSEEHSSHDARWPIPARLLLDLLPPIQAELTESFSGLLKATEEQEAKGQPGFSRESMGHVSEDLDAVNHILAAAREQVEGARG